MSASRSSPACSRRRAQAEDLADQVELELEALPAVVDAVAAMKPGSPRLFDTWPDNAFIASTVTEGDPVIAVGCAGAACAASSA